MTASADNTARVWDARTGQPVGAPLQHHGRRLVGGVQRRRHARGDGVSRQHGAGVGRADGAAGGRAARSMQDAVVSAAFSPDGTRVVTASADNTARVWDARTGQPVGAPLQHADSSRRRRSARDGTRVVTASADKTARVWDARTGQPVGAPLQHGDDVMSAAFSSRRHARGDGVGGQARRGCGTRGRGSRWARRSSTQRSGRRRSAPTARAWSRRQTTTRRGCGTRGRGSRWARRSSTRTSSSRRRSAPTARAW